MADVFICHRHNTAEIARQIASELRKWGISSWYAEKELYAEDSVGLIAREIRECRVFLLVLSQNVLKSQYTESEVALAYRRVMNHEKMTLLSFQVENCDLSGAWAFYLSAVQIMDGNPPDEAHIEKLVQRISRLIGTQQKASVQPDRFPAFGKFVKLITFFLDRIGKRW